MLNCKETTELISKEADERLSLKETLTVHVHMMMCNACRNFRSNIHFLRRACQAAATIDASEDASSPGQR
ncbi:zf-HC2 domain-containing protein [Bordetella sp. FB-8]|uniref:zf-HC2 domain-containing protein n=1 Tax=Bordetella sp. FB-8 TaxID=1159870 RepID=UPI000367AF13|nr:zf-HC2 domain-containing protein [Bordetella sp. FB-8]